MARSKTPPPENPKVGYGKPPLHTRFKKGQSGNPNGRPRGMTGQRVKALVLKEAYRKVRVKEGDDIVALPAIQAILRGQIALAAKGNGPAQRAIIEQLRIIEQEMATDETARTNHQVDRSQYSELDVARRIAFALELGRRKLEQDKRAASETVKQIPDRKDAKR